MDTTSVTPNPASEQDASGWQAAAQPAAPAQATVTAQPPSVAQPAPAPGTGELAQQEMPTYAAPAKPVVLTPVKQGIMGAVDKVLDAIAGTSKPEIAKDQDGNAYVRNASLSRGEQWQRVAGEAIVGAAKGFAAGRGAGHMGDAAAAGVEAGAQMAQQRQQQQKDMTEEARQQNLDAANHQLLTQKVAINALTLANLKAKGSQEDVDWSEKQQDWLENHGGTLLGYVKDGKELAQLMLKTPQFNENHIQKSLMQPVTIYGKDGTAAGMAVYQMKPGANEEMAPPGTPIYTYDALNDKLVPQKTAEPKPMKDVFAINNAAHAQMLEVHAKEATQAHLQAQAAQEQASAAATTAKLPGEVREINARANEANASAQEHLSKAKQTEQASGPLVDEIGTGKVAVDRLGYLLARNPQLLEAVVQKYPDFDSSKAASYPKVYQEFTSTKAGTAGGTLNAGGVALGHLKELSDLNTVQSHIWGTPAYTRYQNKVDTVASELAKFYGNTTIPAIEGIKKTLASTLPGSRHAAIETQAQSMGDKFDEYEQQWKNAAPSKSYEAPMPNVDEKAMEARAALDPKFRARRVAEQGGPGPVAIQQGEQIYTNPKTQQQVVLRGNKYVDVKTGQAVQ